jgi:hypothetical protein
MMPVRTLGADDLSLRSADSDFELEKKSNSGENRFKLVAHVLVVGEVYPSYAIASAYLVMPLGAGHEGP